jgi:hypothetical protein
MSVPVTINLAVEDRLSEDVLRKLVESSERQFAIGTCYCRGGFGYLKSKIAGFNAAAERTPFLVLTDLDRCECAPSLIADWLPKRRSSNLMFRIAVREVEAWLLADRRGLADYLGIAEASIPRNPESLADPKEVLISCARKSKRRLLREAILPAAGTTSKVGPDYNACLGRFVTSCWRPDLAQAESESLARTIRCLRKLR